MLPLLLFLFIVVPIAELAVIIQVGQEIGVWWTIAILIADSILGSLLMRSQGRIAWRRFNEALAGRPAAGARGARRRAGDLRRRVPADAGLHHRHLRAPAADPADARARAAVLVKRFADRMIVAARTGRAGAAAARAARPGDVEGTAVDVDADHLPRGTA